MVLIGRHKDIIVKISQTRMNTLASTPASTYACSGLEAVVDNTPLSMPNLEQLKEAQVRVNNSPHVRRTPLLNNIDCPKEGASSQCFLKLESLQKTGSFKIRGMVNLFAAHEKAIRENGAVTMSAGNAGKAFAFLAGQLQIPAATVCMPNTVPADRVKSIEALGANVVLTTNEGLFPKVEEYVGQGRILAHPFDSHELMAGHASVGFEILEDCPDADIIAVCCGGGGLVGGVAAAVKLSGSKAKIFAVEPTGERPKRASIEKTRAPLLLNQPTQFCFFLASIN